MSLSSILNERDAREFLKGRIRSPGLDGSAYWDVQVRPIAAYQPRIGTAFDYAFRCGLAARGVGTIERLVAEGACSLLPPGGVRERGQRRVREALDVITALPTSELLSDAAARACIVLAGFDVVRRAGRLDEIEREPLVEELRDVQALFAVVPWDEFICYDLHGEREPDIDAYLNPTFDEGSRLVGGADADVIIDDLLLDVKTIKATKLQIEDVRQIVCYALLANKYGINGEKPRRRIHRVGIYFSRAGRVFSDYLGSFVRPSDEEDIVAFLTRGR